MNFIDSNCNLVMDATSIESTMVYLIASGRTEVDSDDHSATKKGLCGAKDSVAAIDSFAISSIHVDSSINSIGMAVILIDFG